MSRDHRAGEKVFVDYAGQKVPITDPRTGRVTNRRPFQKLDGSRRSLILLDRPHPEQGYRACLGVIRLGRRYPPGRIEAAAQRANRSGVRSYKRFQSILENGLDRVPLEPRPETPPAAHPNVRGPHYFGKEATSC